MVSGQIFLIIIIIFFLQYIYICTDQPHPLLAAIGDQQIQISSDEEFIQFSCNILMREEDLHHVEFFEFTQTHSCNDPPHVLPLRQKLWRNSFEWLDDGILHDEDAVDMVVPDMSVKLNYNAFNVTDNVMYVQCGIRFTSAIAAVRTCHKIEISKCNSMPL